MTVRSAGVVLAVALLAGCGSASQSGLDAAADATAAETSRFELSYRIDGLPDDAKVSVTEVEGVFDYPNERGLMTISGDSGDSGDSFPAEFRLISKTGYTRWVVKGRSYWTKQDDVETSGDPMEVLIPFPGSPTKPTDVLTRVLLASDEHEEIGKAEVRGTQTTHYRAQVDVKKLIKQLPEAKRREADVEEAWGSGILPVELWIDDEDRARRITLTAPKDEKNYNPEMTTTVELYDYGVKVDVQPPPADELISQVKLDELLEVELEPSESEEVEPMLTDEVCESARKELPKKKAEVFCLELKEKE